MGLFSLPCLVTNGVQSGDRVLLNDGREVIVEQAAEFDNVFQFSYWDKKGRVRTEWTNLHEVAWNYSEWEWVLVDEAVNP